MMKQKLAGTVFVSMIALSATAIAQTPSNRPTTPPASIDKGEAGNKGGQQRGLDRADQAAGAHGQQGRESARDAQLNQRNEPMRSGPPNRPIRPVRPGR